jgi:hypothetical protein
MVLIICFSASFAVGVATDDAVGVAMDDAVAVDVAVAVDDALGVKSVGGGGKGIMVIEQY